MKLRHPLSGAIYTTRDAGDVEVEARDGRKGIFRHDGAWLRGELRDADAHMLGFICGPAIPRRGVSSPNTESPPHNGVAVPNLNHYPHNGKGKE